MVRQVRLGDSLDLAGFAEADVHDRATDPADEAGGVGQVDEPVEHDAGILSDVEVGEGAEEAGCAYGAVGAAGC